MRLHGIGDTRLGSIGLDPARLYLLYRDAAALKASAPTFNGMPLMSQHVSVTANDPQKYYVVGAISNVRWRAPYLTADLVIWDADAIARIKDGSQREISCAYRYVADMTPGIICGERFAGRMVDIAANHVALVPVGRVGSECIVSDSADRDIKFEHNINSLVPGYGRLPSRW